MHRLYTIIINHDLPIDCQIMLFNQTIIPILLYDSEIWVFSNTKIIENVQSEILRFILQVKRVFHCV